MFHKMYLLAAVLAIASVLAFPAASEPTNHDMYRGETNESVLIYSGLFKGRDFLWGGTNMISAYAIIDNNSVNDSVLIADVFGGLYRDHLGVSFVNDVDVTVYIYSRPENFYFGYNSSTSMLANTTRFTGQSFLDVIYTGDEIIQFVEMLDQTNGTGVYVTHSQGYGTESLLVSLRSSLFQGHIDYIVNVYVENPIDVRPPNHFEFGQLTNSSQHITSHVISIKDLNQFGEYVWPLQQHILDYANLTDLTNGTGAQVRHAAVYGDNFHVQFEQYNTPTFAFLLNVFGQTPTSSPSDLIVGELWSDSVQLLADTVYEHGTTASLVWRSDRPMDRIEVIGASPASLNVKTQLLVGEVGGQSLVVLFEANVQQLIHFDVRVFGRPE